MSTLLQSRIDRLKTDIQELISGYADSDVYMSIGEYALPYDMEWEEIGDQINSGSLAFLLDVRYEQPSSKQGTVFSVRFDRDEFEQFQEELNELNEESLETIKSRVTVFEKLQDLLTRAEAYTVNVKADIDTLKSRIEAFAEGKRKGVMSNGGTVFERINHE